MGGAIEEIAAVANFELSNEAARFCIYPAKISLVDKCATLAKVM